MREHAAKLPIDASAPLLPQPPRLGDTSLRAAVRSLDPLAQAAPDAPKASASRPARRAIE
jgi:hypothetical protein